MAKITFSLDELIHILISNELLRGEILRPKVDGDRIHFVIRTNTYSDFQRTFARRDITSESRR